MISEPCPDLTCWPLEVRNPFLESLRVCAAFGVRQEFFGAA